jgi:hypothetical protein
MKKRLRKELLELLAEIDRRQAEAERLTVEVPVDEIVLRTTAVAWDLRDWAARIDEVRDDRLRPVSS